MCENSSPSAKFSMSDECTSCKENEYYIDQICIYVDATHQEQAGRKTEQLYSNVMESDRKSKF